MPVAYGGNISSISEIKSILSAGIEKVIINTAAFTDPKLIRDAAARFGSQSIVVSIDIKKDLFGHYRAFTDSARRPVSGDISHIASKIQNLGAGEIIVNNIDREGSYKGYDLELIRLITSG